MLLTHEKNFKEQANKRKTLLLDSFLRTAKFQTLRVKSLPVFLDTLNNLTIFGIFCSGLVYLRRCKIKSSKNLKF